MADAPVFSAPDAASDSPKEDAKYAELSELRRWRAERESADKAKADEAKAAQDNTPREQEFYVHLANGDVERVKESELPVVGGTNAAYGHFERDGHAFQVIGVYPVESKVGK